MNILGLALLYKNIPEFYIPVRIDNRGRVYCMFDYLHYQGIELAKSLLLLKVNQIYYSDTDSAKPRSLGLDKSYLNDNWIGVNIGQFKLKYDIK